MRTQPSGIRALLVLLAVSLGTASAQSPPDPDAPLGLGVALVLATDAPPPLRFYAHPGLEALPHEVPVGHATVTDSVTFVPGRGAASVGTAPPWLLPEVLDIDRGRIAFRIETLAGEWMRVVANRADGRTAWIRRDRAEILSWPEVVLLFLVTVDPETNPLRTRPTREAPILATTPPDWRLRPLAVRGDWLLVSTLGLADRIPPSGWVRWTDGERLLVSGIGRE